MLVSLYHDLPGRDRVQGLQTCHSAPPSATRPAAINGASFSAGAVAFVNASPAKPPINQLQELGMRSGVELADATHQSLLSQRVARTEVDLAEAIEAMDTDCLLEWKRVFTFLKSIRRTLPYEDALLAAQCLAKGHVLVTDIAKHFELLRPLGLKVVDPPA